MRISDWSSDVCSSDLSFDLHVLGLPPAFVLSQDQTLRLTSPNAPAKTTGTPGSSTGSSQVKTREIPPIQAPKTPAKAKARKPNSQDPSNTRSTKRPQCQNTRTSPTKARPDAPVPLPKQQCPTAASCWPCTGRCRRAKRPASLLTRSEEPT